MANTKIPVELSSTPGIVDNSNATAITIDSSEIVSIGHTSAVNDANAPLQLNAPSGGQKFMMVNADGSYGLMLGYDMANSTARIRNIQNTPLTFETNNAERMRIDSSGNVGIGMVPTTNNISKSISLVNGGSIFGYGNGTYITANSNFNGAWNTVATGADSRILLDGNVVFSRSTSASAGSAGAVSESMRIDSSGNVGIGTSSPSDKLEIGTTTTGGNLRLVSSLYGSNGLARFYGTDGNEKLQLGALSASAAFMFTPASTDLVMYIGNAERMRIDSSGNLLVGVTSGTSHFIKKALGNGSAVLEITGNNLGSRFFNADGGSPNAANSAQHIYSVGATGRSINAAGTINASGADYAEYMKKSDSCGTITKGNVCGVDSTGKLTDVFADAISFVIKSTNPSYVGGDNWGGTELELTEEQYETERQKYDRIAFSGQVPVNITGSFNVGDYVYPQANGTAIECVAKSNPTFEEYQLCVGKIWATEDDGRPLVAVKIG